MPARSLAALAATLVALAVSACGQNEWRSGQKVKFLNQCSVLGLGEQTCYCIMFKLEEKYTAEQVGNVGRLRAREVLDRATECAEGA